MTYGEKAVGISFNPSANPEIGQMKQMYADIDQMKQMYADIIDLLNNARAATTDQELKRLYSDSITEVQKAQMWAAKVITWTV